MYVHTHHVLCMHMSECMRCLYVCRHEHACVCMHVEVRGHSMVPLLRGQTSCFVETVFPWPGAHLLGQAGWTGALRICLLLSPQCWNSKAFPQIWLFHMGLGSWNQGLTLRGKPSGDPSPQLLHF